MPLIQYDHAKCDLCTMFTISLGFQFIKKIKRNSDCTHVEHNNMNKKGTQLNIILIILKKLKLYLVPLSDHDCAEYTQDLD